MKRYDIKTTDTETLRKWYYLMSLGRALDEKAPSYLLQSLGWSYHAPYAGHDGIQLAIGQVFHRGEDYLFPYYRDMLTVLSAGMTAEEIILNGISKATDPSSGGRHMSNHFAKPEWHIENISSATGTHDLHAVGVARAMVYYDHKGVAITSHGESATSEGYVYEAINGASNEQLPRYLCLAGQRLRHLRPQKGPDGQPQGSRQLLRFQEPAYHPLQRKRRFRLDERHDRSPRTCDQYA